MTIENTVQAIEARLGALVRRIDSLPDEIAYECDATQWLEVARVLRDEPTLRFEMLMDLAGVDYSEFGKSEWKTFSATGSGFSRGVNRSAVGEVRQDGVRFAVVVQLLSITNNQRLRLRAFCADDAEPIIDSLVDIWSSANWFEREAFDLFGILFRGHPDLRRLLTDYGFIGHPFRKDFPLIGNVEVRYDPAKQRVVYEPVSIEPRTLVPRVIRHDNRYDPALDGT
ncbi:MAG: NADH-quinone oxidoreductase subunit C [Steroidobacteraceae bacterium]|jgi:NADH-quinone oxidoreductase subunit C